MLVLKGVPPDQRAYLWLLSSGAKREMFNNPGYYNYLVDGYPSETELPTDKQIDLVKNIFIIDRTLKEHSQKIPYSQKIQLLKN